MKELTIQAEDVTISYRVTGQGDPVMLVHGFGEDSSVWDTIAPALEKYHMLIIPDLPGSGRSSNIPADTIDDMADQLHRIVETENIGQLVMIGHSMGGYVTLAYAEKYPDRLKKFGLFHSSAFADSDEKKEARDKNIDFIRRHGAYKFLQQSVPNLFSEAYRSAHADQIKNWIERYQNFSGEALIRYTEAMKARPDRTAVLRDFKNPILMILGEEDNAVPIEQGLQQTTLPEFAYIYIAARSGHMGMLEEPDFCLRAIQDFLSDS